MVPYNSGTVAGGDVLLIEGRHIVTAGDPKQLANQVFWCAFVPSKEGQEENTTKKYETVYYSRGYDPKVGDLASEDGVKAGGTFKCKTPQVQVPQDFEVAVSLNGQQYTRNGPLSAKPGEVAQCSGNACVFNYYDPSKARTMLLGLLVLVLLLMLLLALLLVLLSLLLLPLLLTPLLRRRHSHRRCGGPCPSPAQKQVRPWCACWARTSGASRALAAGSTITKKAV